jgi:hypothetical protein
MPDTVSDIVIMVGSQFIKETVINIRCGTGKAQLCISLWFSITVMARGVLERPLFIIFPFASFHTSFAFQRLEQLVSRIKFMPYSRRITRNRSNSEIVISVCSLQESV